MPLQNPEGNPEQARILEIIWKSYNRVVNFIDSKYSYSDVKNSRMLTLLSDKARVINCINYIKWMVGIRRGSANHLPAPLLDPWLDATDEQLEDLDFLMLHIYAICNFAEEHYKIFRQPPPVDNDAVHAMGMKRKKTKRRTRRHRKHRK